jgi:radical SAM protein with 4Fe4S-binding SPASM domain
LVGLSSNGTRKFDFSIFDSVTTTQDSEREFKIEGPNVDYQTLCESHPKEDYTHTTPLKLAPSNICMTPYNYVSIQWDGDVVPCCKSHGKQHIFGNLHDQSFEDIIKSHKRMAFLDNMMEQGKKANYICRYCTDPNPHMIHEKLISKINARSR